MSRLLQRLRPRKDSPPTSESNTPEVSGPPGNAASTGLVKSADCAKNNDDPLGLAKAWEIAHRDPRKSKTEMFVDKLGTYPSSGETSSNWVLIQRMG